MISFGELKPATATPGKFLVQSIHDSPFPKSATRVSPNLFFACFAYHFSISIDTAKDDVEDVRGPSVWALRFDGLIHRWEVFHSERMRSTGGCACWLSSSRWMHYFISSCSWWMYKTYAPQLTPLGGFYHHIISDPQLSQIFQRQSDRCSGSHSSVWMMSSLSVFC